MRRASNIRPLERTPLQCHAKAPDAGWFVVVQEPFTDNPGRNEMSDLPEQRLRKLASREISGEIPQFEYSLAADELARLRAENETLKADTKWRPIKTAPRDGTLVLLGTDKVCADGFWNGLWVWPYINRNPTHWRPLPPLSPESVKGQS